MNDVAEGHGGLFYSNKFIRRSDTAVKKRGIVCVKVMEMTSLTLMNH